MQVYLGADHRGWELKEAVKAYLKEEGYELVDVGNKEFDPDDDYVDFVVKVAEMVEGGEESVRGILFCGSGHGVEMVANRFPHVRAVLGFNLEVTQQGREHEDANVLVLPAEWVDEEDAKERVETFLTTDKSEEERYARRRERVANLEVRR